MHLAHRQALVHQRGERDLPPLPHRAEPLRIGHAHIGEEHLVEVRRARHLVDRPDLDPRRAHVEEEERQPLVLRHVRIGPHDDDAEVRQMRARGPDLLPVDDPVIAVALRPRAQRRQVRPARGFGEQLAPHLLAAQRRPHVAIELFRLRIRHHRRDAHAETDLEQAARHRVVVFLLVVDHLQDRRRLAPAELLRPGDGGEACIGLLRLPRPCSASPHRRRDRPAAAPAAPGSWVPHWPSRNARASARNAASSGVSLKSMPRLLCRVAHFEQFDQPVLPPRRATRAPAQAASSADSTDGSPRPR